ncbi:MAG: hypothetical protein ACO3E1_12395, partial [Flavobacteriales bacterium]
MLSCRIILVLLFFGLSQFHVDAQIKKDTIIHFQSGDYSPKKNVDQLAINATSLNEVLFKEYYYAVIQFETIPNPDIRKSLTQLSIELFDYIPSNAYTARIPRSINWKKLNELAVRAIFPL